MLQKKQKEQKKTHNVTRQGWRNVFLTPSSGVISKLLFPVCVNFYGWITQNIWGYFIVSTIVMH